MNKKENKKLDKSLKFLAKTSFIILIGIVLSKLFTYLYKIVIARYFGPEAYGLFSLAIMVLGLFGAIASLGLVEGVLRFTSLYRARNEVKKIHYLLRFSISILIISGIIFSFILFFTAELISINIFHNANLIIYLKSFSIIIPFGMIFGVFLQILRVFEKVKSFSFLQNILQNGLKLLFLLLFIILGFNADTSIIFSSISGIFILLVLSYILARKAVPHILTNSVLKENQKSQIRTALIYYSWPLVFSGLIAMLFYWTDSFALGYFKDAATVGFYNAAVPIALLFLIPSEIFMQFFYPLINKEYSIKNFKLIKELSKQISKWIFVINFPALLFMLLFPGVIINFLFGSQYLIAENSLRILAGIMFFNSIVAISAHLIMMMGRSKFILLNTLIFSILNLILDIILVPAYGMNGAATATFISLFLSGVLSMFWVYHYLAIITLRRKMFRIAVISLVLFIPLLILEHFVEISAMGLAIIGIIFLILYFGLIYLTACLDKNDMLIFNSIKKKVFNK